MLSTIDLNFFSYLFVNEFGQTVAEIHHEPDQELVHDTQPWCLYINDQLLHKDDSFMKCFRVAQRSYKMKLAS